jgi:hypothetical protein
MFRLIHPGATHSVIDFLVLTDENNSFPLTHSPDVTLAAYLDWRA